MAVQGKPVVRRGRKTRDLPGDRPVAGQIDDRSFRRRERQVKANLARFTWALMLLASMALTIGAGMRWD
jgi:hypothetical protein